MVKKLVQPYRIKFDEESRQRIFELMQAPFNTGMVGDHVLCRMMEKHVLSLYPHFKYAVAVSDCTTALEIVYKYLKRFHDIGSVDVQDHTFISDFWAAENAGLGVSLVDGHEDDYMGSLSSDTEALLVAPIGGIVPKRLAGLYYKCKRDGVPLVVDAAHALGASPGSDSYLKASYLTFSFGRIKMATGGTGGMIVTNDEQCAEYARSMIEWGKRGHKNFYHGVSGLMSEWNAAVAIERMERMPQEIVWREGAAIRYDEALKKFSDRVCYGAFCARGTAHTNFYRYYVVAAKGWDLDYAGIMIEMLNEYGIHLPARVYQYGIHEQDDFKERYDNYKNSQFPNTMHITKNHICLPCYMDMGRHSMDYSTVEYVADCIKEILPKFIRKVK